MGRSLIIDGIEVDVIRKSGTRSMRLKIDRKTGRPTVTIPYFCPVTMAKPFVAGHMVWIKKQLESAPRQNQFYDGEKITVLGQLVVIRHDPTLKRGVFIQEDTLFVSGDAVHLHRRVKDFIKKQALDYAVVRAKTMGKELGLPVSRVSLKDTVSRWGSCSSTGNLSLCWRLGLAPLFVFDYVIAHEVTHLDEMNHSHAFWAKLKQIEPQMREAKKWLDQHGPSLHRYV